MITSVGTQADTAVPSTFTLNAPMITRRTLCDYSTSIQTDRQKHTHIQREGGRDRDRSRDHVYTEFSPLVLLITSSSSNLCQFSLLCTVSQKKLAAKRLSMHLRQILADFNTFFHWRTLRKICNNVTMKHPTTHLTCATALPVWIMSFHTGWTGSHITENSWSLFFNGIFM